MATLQDIRQRRQTIQSIGKMMSAMKVVAATKVRQLEDLWQFMGKQFQSLNHDLAQAAPLLWNDEIPTWVSCTPPSSDALREEIWFVVAADRGLCGGYNGSIIRELTRRIAERGTSHVRFALVGRKVARLIGNLIPEDQVIFETPLEGSWGADTLRALNDCVYPLLNTPGKVCDCYVLSTHFHNILKQEVHFERFAAPLEDVVVKREPGLSDVLSPSPEVYVKHILKLWFTFRVSHFLCEGALSEQGARMSAMESATRNSDDLIGDLDLTYNRTRQAMITRQLIEVISGASIA
jgi:F-type H+-transporting ATPase subunit gamma